MSALHSCAVVAAIAATLTASCGGRIVRTTASDPSAVDVSALWIEPADIETRDLFAGPVAGVPAPGAAMPFTFVRADTAGYSQGYDVRDPSGVEWSVKLGPEAQWSDAFRAAGYPSDQAERYIAKIKSKIAEGLALGDASRTGETARAAGTGSAP